MTFYSSIKYRSEMSREQRLALRNFRSRNAVKEEKARVVNTEIITGINTAGTQLFWLYDEEY